jgi:hypothetical protein
MARKETSYPRWIDVKQGLFQNEMPTKEEVDKRQYMRWLDAGWKNHETQVNAMNKTYGKQAKEWWDEWKQGQK